MPRRVGWTCGCCAELRNGQKGSVDSVHTFHLGLARSVAGLARIPHVSGTSQCLQGVESRSSPTSGTAYPLV